MTWKWILRKWCGLFKAVLILRTILSAGIFTLSPGVGTKYRRKPRSHNQHSWELSFIAKSCSDQLTNDSSHIVLKHHDWQKLATLRSTFCWSDSSVSCHRTISSHRYSPFQMRLILTNQWAFLWERWVTNGSNHFPAGISLHWQQVLCASNQGTWLVSYKNHFLSPVSQPCFGCWPYPVCCDRKCWDPF